MTESPEHLPQNITELIESAVGYVHDFKETGNSINHRMNMLMAGEIALQAAMDMLHNNDEHLLAFTRNASNIRQELERLKEEGAELVFNHTFDTVQGFLEESVRSLNDPEALVNAGIALGCIDNAIHNESLTARQRSRLLVFQAEIRQFITSFE
ncbi:hypothetical protein ACFL54_06140 [Planctomycetota bacterium]